MRVRAYSAALNQLTVRDSFTKVASAGDGLYFEGQLLVVVSFFGGSTTETAAKGLGFVFTI